jgi:hypothetical protein
MAIKHIWHGWTTHTNAHASQALRHIARCLRPTCGLWFVDYRWARSVSEVLRRHRRSHELHLKRAVRRAPARSRSDNRLLSRGVLPPT